MPPSLSPFLTASLLTALTSLPGCTSAVPSQYQPAAPLTVWSDDLYAQVLGQLVTPNGLVRYDDLRTNRDGVRDKLFRYVAQLGAASPENRPDLFPTAADQLAYWINAYNAICMYRVVQRGYPSNIIASVPPAAIFFTDRTPVGGRAYTLDGLEKQKVLSVGDPRVHFALNCASYSCPPLRREPYSGPKLDAQLADQGRIYLSDPRAVRRIDRDTVGLNSIFTSFYPDDFTSWYERAHGRKGTVLDALKLLAAPDSPVRSATKSTGIGYDWGRNDANRG